MFRNRVIPPTPPLDEVTAERLLSGAPIDDLPEAYQPLGQLLADARRPGTDAELAGSAVAAATFVAAHHAANGPRRRVRSMGASALFVLTLAATTGTAVAATQGALPQPIQQVAHEALGAVGISVPGIESQRDRTDDGGSNAPAGRRTDPATAVTPTTPTTPATGAPAATPGADGATNDDPTTGGNEPQGVAGENPNAGPGNNSGNGNPNPGDGNQGNAGGGQTGAETPDTPPNNLPENSNGNGNGPPQVPPGQAKK